MRTDGLLSIKPIKSDLIPPIDPKTGEPAVPTGEVFRDPHGESHIVYRGSFVDLEATSSLENREPIMNPETGEQLTRKSDQGPYKVFHRPTVFVEEEFILERGPAEIRIIRGFRPSEDEVERREQADMVRSFERGLAQEAVKRGLTAGQLVERVMGALGVGDDEETAPAPSVAGDVEVVEVSPGWYNVVVDGETKSETNLRERDAEDLADTFRVPVGVGAEEEDDEGSY